jgi:2-oxo-4-hydroxy-4-carboxy-5-ureidoimidazoline decarboxylase
VAPMRLDEVNALDESAFVAAFGHVYEASPHLAAAVWRRRPFASTDELGEAFVAVADELDPLAATALLRAHPQLGARTAMAAASVAEQRGAGLATDDAIVDRIRVGNAVYVERFGFPFVIAVRGLDPDAIADALDVRLGNDLATERAEALRQVQRIARLRLDDVVVG